MGYIPLDFSIVPWDNLRCFATDTWQLSYHCCYCPNCQPDPDFSLWTVTFFFSKLMCLVQWIRGLSTMFRLNIVFCVVYSLHSNFKLLNYVFFKWHRGWHLLKSLGLYSLDVICLFITSSPSMTFHRVLISSSKSMVEFAILTFPPLLTL